MGRKAYNELERLSLERGFDWNFISGVFVLDESSDEWGEDLTDLRGLHQTDIIDVEDVIDFFKDQFNGLAVQVKEE